MENLEGKRVLKTEACLKELENLLIEAERASNVERSGFLLTAREKVSDCIESNLNNSEMNYLAGLIMYHSFDEEEKYGDYAKQYLQKAIELNPNHQFARMYLGHYYFDIKAFQEALSYLQNIDENYFSSINQKWRILKLHELTLCCRIFLDDSDIKQGDFDLLFQEYLNTNLEDIPVPLELAQTLFLTKESVIWDELGRSQIKTKFIEMTKMLSFFNPLKKYFDLDLT